MRVNTLTSLLAINAAAVSMAARGANLKTVDEHDEPEGEDTLQAGGGGTTVETEDEDSVAENFQPSFDVSDLPDDLPDVRSPAEAIAWGFSDWPVGAHMFVPVALAQRARGALQNARTTKDGKPNGKVFQTFEVIGVKSAMDRAKAAGITPVKGDIEVWRRPDKVAPKAATAPVKETENA